MNNIVEKHRKRKRILDICLSIIGLVGFAPFFLCIILILKLGNPRAPVFFVQKRIGRGGELFSCIKFRTMVPNAESVLQHLLDTNVRAREEFVKDFKLRNDPRIIPGIGRFLRQTSLDELPQIINVLRGEMSWVGPRPIVPKESEKYGEFFATLITVKPGITGLWQTSGRNDISYEDRVLIDMKYINEMNIRNDLRIIFNTVKVVFKGEGAY